MVSRLEAMKSLVDVGFVGTGPTCPNGIQNQTGDKAQWTNKNPQHKEEAANGTPTGNYARLQALAKTLKHPEAVDAPSQPGAYPCPLRVRCTLSTKEGWKHNVNNLHY